MPAQQHSRQRGPSFSRRDFLKGSGAAVAATAIVTAPQEIDAAQESGPKVTSAEPTEVTLTVNGRNYRLKVEPRVTLLEVLRNDLNLTGAKEVCETTTCGACTVLIDGKATYACARLAIECEGQDIRTIESLRNGDQVDEVIAGFVKHDATQCGFCTPGFVMATKAFLAKHPKATLEDVRKGLGGNICRCGTYKGITECALELARKGGA
ncbi:MAG: (2Fe-2S)-binding protein [Planctomycetes bacterium]|nr:(2Fe-2S)-binding protein [Planctomycetota bacterium]